jgi:hypothetical protein
MEKYIKYTDIPYTELLERAKRGGLLVRFEEKRIVVADNEGRSIDLYTDDMHNIDDGFSPIVYNYSL